MYWCVCLELLEASAGPAAGISNLQALRSCRPCSHFQPAASVLGYVHVVIVCSHSEAAGPSLAACLSEPSLRASMPGASAAFAGPAAGTSKLQAVRTCRPCSHFQPAASICEYVHVVTVCSHFEGAGPDSHRALSACQHGWTFWSLCWICRRMGICWICRGVGTLGRWR